MRRATVDDRAGWMTGALVGSLLGGLAITAMMIATERASAEPSELIDLGRTGASRLGLDPPPRKAMPDAAEQMIVQGAHLALSGLGGLAYAAAYDEDAPVVQSGLAFGMAFYVACHWLAGPALRLKPPEWRSPPTAIGQHVAVHAVFGLVIAAGAAAARKMRRS